MMADLFDFAQPTAEELAQDGMQRAIEHADAVEGGWSEMAYAMLEQYAFSHFEFMMEEVRRWAQDNGLSAPPTARAWGAVALRASRDRLIVKAGHRNTINPLAHGALATVWHSQIYREAA
jgi:hypothetical protein